MTNKIKKKLKSNIIDIVKFMSSIFLALVFFNAFGVFLYKPFFQPKATKAAFVASDSHQQGFIHLVLS